MIQKTPVPSSWPSVPLGRLFEKQDRAPAPDVGVVTAFRDGQVTLRSERRVDGFTEAIKEIGYQGIQKGDLVIHAMDAFAGAIGVSECDGKSSPVYSALTPRQSANPRFFAYVLRNFAISGAIQALTQGVRERSTDFRWRIAKSVLVPVPPISEQRVIADYLDHETAEIDALISAHDRLIELLRERHQSAIDNAVSSLPNKQPLRRAIAYLTSGSRGWSELLGEVGSPFVRITNIARNSIDPLLEDMRFVEDPTQSEGARSRIELGDLLMSITADLGSVSVADESLVGGFTSQHVCLIRLDRSKALSEYVAYSLLSTPVRAQIRQKSYGGTKVQLSLGDVKELEMQLPSLELQAEAAAKCSEISHSTETLIRDAQQVRNIAKERRAALISAAVTGQIDVTSRRRGPSEAERLESELARTQ